MSDGIFPNEGDQPMIEGEVQAWTLTVPYTTVSATGHKAYKNGSSVSSSCLTGAVSTTGNVITTKTFTVQSGYAGTTIMHAVTATCDGQTRVFKIRCPISKAGDE